MMFLRLLSSVLCFGIVLSAHSTVNRQTKRRNIIVIMTDDQDVVLGSMRRVVMPKTNRLLTDEGVDFVNAFVTSPICCPSRSSFFTGMYVHNHNVYTNRDNCSNSMWRNQYEPKSFGPVLKSAGYTTAYFGKYLNGYDGKWIPPGWKEWVGLIKNSRFYNYSLNVNGQKVEHGADYSKDYLTDLIANDSAAFFQRSKHVFPNKPVLMVLCPPAPHGPEDSAPQYQNMFLNDTSHRTPSWDFAPNPDKNWILRYTGKMEPIHKDFTDTLHTKRLQTLRSVDDLVEKVYEAVKKEGELENTYIIFTSDHGYHLGQYGLIKGKSLPHEFDIRVPFLIRGPNLPRAFKMKDIVLNVDIAPTLIDLAGATVPEYMDGVSFLPLLRKIEIKNTKHSASDMLKNHSEVAGAPIWRDTFLIERGKITPKKLREIEVMEALHNKLLQGEDRSDLIRHYPALCQNELFLSCKPEQKWHCVKSERNNGRWRIKKCKYASPSARMKPSTGSFINTTAGDDVGSSTSGFGLCLCDEVAARVDQRRRPRQRETNAWYSNRNSRPNRRRPFAHRLRHRTRRLRRHLDASLIALYSPDSVLSARCRYAYEYADIRCDQGMYDDTKYRTEYLKRLRLQMNYYREALLQLRKIELHLERYNLYSAADLPEPLPESQLSPTPSSSPSTAKPKLCPCAPPTMPARSYGGSRRRDRTGSSSRRAARQRRKQKFTHRMCNVPNLNCFHHDKNHWKTPPLWTGAPFCFCTSSNNGTYWCLRTINETHNFLYCEYITGFISYYDLLVDPHQLQNRVKMLSFITVNQLRDQLLKLRACRGATECTMKSNQPSEISSIRQSSPKSHSTTPKNKVALPVMKNQKSVSSNGKGGSGYGLAQHSERQRAANNKNSRRRMRKKERTKKTGNVRSKNHKITSPGAKDSTRKDTLG